MKKRTAQITAAIAAGTIATIGLGVAPALAADSGASALATHRGEGPGGGHPGRAFDREVLTEVLGVTEDELKAARDAGKTLAELAEGQDVPVQTLIDALVEASEERIAEAVENGRFTQEEADEKLADLEERITNRVNGLRPDGSEHPDRGDRPAGDRPDRGWRPGGDRQGGEGAGGS